jgi:Glycosyltransferase
MVVYQAIDDDTHRTAFSMRKTVKRSNQVLCVSVMAPHKGIETLVKAVDVTRKLYGLPVKLVLVGGWPDRKYERQIRSLVNELNLESEVEFKGHISDHDLYKYYAESKLFCLMSRCESFGIPAIEAQAFGTPVISSNCCAVPEVCGQGGVYFSPDDDKGVASQLAQLLKDDKTWNDLSNAAIENAAKYRWETCSRPLLKMLDLDSSIVKTQINTNMHE